MHLQEARDNVAALEEELRTYQGPQRSNLEQMLAKARIKVTALEEAQDLVGSPHHIADEEDLGYAHYIGNTGHE